MEGLGQQHHRGQDAGRGGGQRGCGARGGTAQRQRADDQPAAEGCHDREGRAEVTLEPLREPVQRRPAAQVHHHAPGDDGGRGEHLCRAAQVAQARRERGDAQQPEPHDRRPEFLQQRPLGGGGLAAEHDGHRAAGGGLAAEDAAGVVDVDRVARRQHRHPGQRQQQRPGLRAVPPAHQVRQADQRHQDEQHRRVQGGHRVVEHRGGAHHGHQRGGAHRRGLVHRDQRRDGHHQQEEGGDEVGVAAPGEAVERAGQHQPGQRRRAEPVLPAPEPGGQGVGAERGDDEQHRRQHREQRQRGEAGEPADDRGERGEARAGRSGSRGTGRARASARP